MIVETPSAIGNCYTHIGLHPGGLGRHGSIGQVSGVPSD